MDPVVFDAWLESFLLKVDHAIDRAFDRALEKFWAKFPTPSDVQVASEQEPLKDDDGETDFPKFGETGFSEIQANLTEDAANFEDVDEATVLIKRDSAQPDPSMQPEKLEAQAVWGLFNCQRPIHLPRYDGIWFTHSIFMAEFLLERAPFIHACIANFNPPDALEVFTQQFNTSNETYPFINNVVLGVEHIMDSDETLTSLNGLDFVLCVDHERELEFLKKINVKMKYRKDLGMGEPLDDIFSICEYISEGMDDGGVLTHSAISPNSHAAFFGAEHDWIMSHGIFLGMILQANIVFPLSFTVFGIHLLTGLWA